MEKKVMTHFTKGLIIGLVMVAIGITFQVLDIYDRWVQWVVLAAYAGAIIWACISFSSDMDGDVTFGKVFSHGFKTAAIVTLIAIASFFITYLVMPEMKEKAMEMARAEMAKNPQMTDEIIDKALEFTNKYFLLFGVIGSLFSYALVGVIASLIGGGVAKKNPSNGMPQSM
jgi:NADH:ubiquinone oxidoreductase subunit 6 (subunit J)